MGVKSGGSRCGVQAAMLSIRPGGGGLPGGIQKLRSAFPPNAPHHAIHLWHSVWGSYRSRFQLRQPSASSYAGIETSESPAFRDRTCDPILNPWSRCAGSVPSAAQPRVKLVREKLILEGILIALSPYGVQRVPARMFLTRDQGRCWSPTWTVSSPDFDLRGTVTYVSTMKRSVIRGSADAQPSKSNIQLSSLAALIPCAIEWDSNVGSLGHPPSGSD